MALDGLSGCVKYLMFGFNLLFLVTGVVILGVGSWLYHNVNHFVDWTDAGSASYAIILICVGVIIVLTTFFGCCGAIKENHCFMMTFAVSLLIIVIVEASVGVACYVKRGELESVLHKKFTDSIEQYDSRPDIKKAFDMIQTDLQCCGVNGPSDWPKIPESCCSSGLVLVNQVAQECKLGSTYIHKDGCLPKLLTLLQNNAFTLGIVAIAVAGVQLLGVIFACCLARSIRKDYQTV